MPLVLLASLASATEWYVDAQHGDDAHPGTSVDTAFATIQKAAEQAAPGDTVSILAGVYRESIVPANSGTSAAPIRYRAYDGQTVVVSGLDRLSATWTREGSSRIHAATVPAGAMQLGNRNQVFVDGRPLALARWPDLPADLDQLRPRWSRIQARSVVSGPEDAVWTMTVSDDRLPVEVDWTGALMAIQADPTAPWASARVEAWDPARQQLTIAVRPPHSAAGNLPFGPGSEGADDGSRYWLAGVPGALDSPGEWSYDPATRRLRLWLPGGADPTDHRIEVRADRPYGFNLEQRNHIIISGLRFLGTTVVTETFPTVGELYNNRFDPDNPRSRGIVLEDLDFRSVFHADSADLDGGPDFDPVDPYFFGLQDKGVVLAGADHVIRRCSISGSAANGLIVLGDNILVEHNRIQQVSTLPFESAAITLGDLNHYSRNHVIRWNSLHDSGNYLLRFYAARHCLIHHNDLWAGKTLVTDGAMAYTWGSDNTGTEIAYNHLHDAFNEIYGGMALYFDLNAKNALVYRNVFWNVDTGILVNSNGHDGLHFQHNTLHSWNGEQVRMIMRNADSDNSARSNLVHSSLDQDGTTDDADPVLDRNLIGTAVDGQQAPAFLLAPDPGFVDPAALDFSLRADSPAVDSGSDSPLPVRILADGSARETAGPETLQGAADIGAYERGGPAWAAVGSPVDGHTPGSPRRLVAQPGQAVTAADLTWEAPPTGGSGTVIVERKIGAWFQTVARLAAGSTAYSETGLRPGPQTYRIRTAAGGHSNIAQVVTGRDPSRRIVPTSFDAINDVGSSMTILENHGLVTSQSDGDWLRYDRVGFGEAGSFTEATVSYVCGGTATIELWIDDPATGTMLARMELTGPDWGTPRTATAAIAGVSGTHDLYVKFVGFTSNLSGIVFGPGPVDERPDAPDRCTATRAGTDGIALSWAEAARADRYRIEYSRDGYDFVEIADLDAGSTEHLHANSTGGRWFYRVRAVNAAGSSPSSPLAAITVPVLLRHLS
ncbi:MAG: carbohydrate-binding protein, partial [Planctomycetota bacterium]